MVECVLHLVAVAAAAAASVLTLLPGILPTFLLFCLCLSQVAVRERGAEGIMEVDDAGELGAFANETDPVWLEYAAALREARAQEKQARMEQLQAKLASPPAPMATAAPPPPPAGNQPTGAAAQPSGPMPPASVLTVVRSWLTDESFRLLRGMPQPMPGAASDSAPAGMEDEDDADDTPMQQDEDEDGNGDGDGGGGDADDLLPPATTGAPAKRTYEREPALPLLDNQSQLQRRRNLMWDFMAQACRPILGRLNLPFGAIHSELANLIDTLEYVKKKEEERKKKKKKKETEISSVGAVF